MNQMKKFLAVLLSAVMCLSLIPAVSFNAVQAETTVKTLTEAEKSAKISEIIDFSGRLNEMTEQYAVPYTKDAADTDPYASARIVVKSANELDYTGSIAYVNGYNDLHVIQYATPEEARKAVEMYESVDGVQYAEPDAIMSIAQEPGVDEFLSWGYAPEHVSAFNYNEWLYSYYGGMENFPEIIVAVIDTGCDSDHEYLEAQLLDNGYDFVNNDNNPEDDHGHGSHCAGTVIDGNLPNVRILPIKVLDGGGFGNYTNIALGMEWAYLQGADAANLSLSGPCEDAKHELYTETITEGMAHGTIYCVAAGNNYGADVETRCPANVEEAVTVASHDSSRNLSDFSNVGDKVDITAPGSDVYSVNMGGGYCYKSGTSMATPHVAAACALVRSFNPDMTVDDVVDVLKDAAIDEGIEGSGVGFLCMNDLFKFDAFINGEGTNLHYTSGGDYPWNVEGNTALSSNAGVDNSESILVSNATLGAYQRITFEYRVSSEENDIFRFCANGEVLLEASGEQDWQTASVVIPGAGLITLTWEYIKDATGAAGDDTAYIRNIVLEETISSTVNAEGSDLYFANDEVYPWVIDGEAVKSGNAGADATVSEITAVAENIPAGVVFMFNYKVSGAEGDMFQFLVDGEVVLEADGEIDWTEYQYVVRESGAHEFTFRYVKDAAGAAGEDAAWVDNAQLTYTLESVLNVEGGWLDFESEGAYPWVVCENEYAKSSNEGRANTSSTISLTVELTAGQTLNFDYKVSSKLNDDKLIFYVNGAKRFVRSGNLSWNSYSYTVEEAGTYTFEWVYEKNRSEEANDDCAYLDNVCVTGASTVLPGDCNEDGIVNIADALLALRYSIGGAVEINLEAADVNGDGQVNIADALAILRLAIGG